MDNSPLWDEALARIELTADQVPEYRRVDVELANPAERPTDEEYDRYAYLVGLFRDLDYRADRIKEATPFALQSVLFNSLLVQANLDLAEIAREPRRGSRRVRGLGARPQSTWTRGSGASRTPLRRLRPPIREARHRSHGSGPRPATPASRAPSAPAGWSSVLPARAWRSTPLAGQSRVSSPGDPATCRRGTGAVRSGPSSTGSCSGDSTATASRRWRQESGARSSTSPAGAASGSTTVLLPARGRGARLRMDRRARARHPFHRDGVRGGRSTHGGRCDHACRGRQCPIEQRTEGVR